VYDPYLWVTDDRGEPVRKTNIISPGALIKTTVLIAEVLNESYLWTTDENGNLVKRGINGVMGFVKSALNILRFDFQEIFEFIIMELMTIVIILAGCFFVVQYVMCVLEYFVLPTLNLPKLTGAYKQGYTKVQEVKDGQEKVYRTRESTYYAGGNRGRQEHECRCRRKADSSKYRNEMAETAA
jgi:hypothetical protein